MRLLLLLFGITSSLCHVSLEGLEPDFLEPLENLTVAQGRDAVFTCSVTRLNDYTVGWVKSDTKAIQAIGRNVVTYDTRVSVENTPGSPTWKLVIKNVQPSDAGIYMAQINTDPMKSQVAHLTVMKPPNIDDSATPSQRLVKEYEAVILECRASGHPAPNISWRRDDGMHLIHNPCRGSNEILHTVKGNVGRGRLCIASATRNMTGAYFCIASNGVLPSVSKRIHLVVQFPPTVRAENPIVGSFVGSNQVVLECTVEASPQPYHFWHKGNHTIGAMDRYVTKVRSVNAYTVTMILAIQNVNDDDAGLYRCQAGDQQAVIRLYVNYVTTQVTVTAISRPTPVPTRRKTATVTTSTFTTAITTHKTTAGITIAAQTSSMASTEAPIDIFRSNNRNGYIRKMGINQSSDRTRPECGLCSTLTLCALVLSLIM